MALVKFGFKVSAVLLSSAVLSACGSGGGETPTPAPTSSAPAQQSSSSSPNNTSSSSGTESSSPIVNSSSSDSGGVGSSSSVPSNSSASSSDISSANSASSMPNNSSSSTSSTQSSTVSSTPASSSSVSSQNSSSMSSSVASSNSSYESSSSSSESSSSSSEAPAPSATVEYVYPPQASHLGGMTATPVSLKVVAMEVGDVVSSVTLDGQTLDRVGDLWRTSSDLVVAANAQGQEFSVEVIVDSDQTLLGNPLVLNNIGGDNPLRAGNTPIDIATGVTVSDSGDLYFTDAPAGRLYRYDRITAESSVIYEVTTEAFNTQNLNWSVAAHGDTVYLAQDVFSYEDMVGSDNTTVSLVKVENAGTNPIATAFTTGNDILNSAHGLFLDIDGESIPSEGSPSVFSLDLSGQNPLSTWFEADNGFVALDLVISADGEGNNLKPELSPLAMAGYLDGENTVMTVLQRSKNDSLIKEISLYTIAAGYDARGRVVLTAEVSATFPQMLKPTAMVYSEDGSTLYIADNNRIWAANTADYQLTVVSETLSTDDEEIGQGPSLGASISQLALHPSDSDYLYAATGSSVMLINVQTGNRIVLIK